MEKLVDYIWPISQSLLHAPAIDGRGCCRPIKSVPIQMTITSDRLADVCSQPAVAEHRGQTS